MESSSQNTQSPIANQPSVGGGTTSSFSGGAVNVIDLIDEIFSNAVKVNASDIHIEPTEEKVNIRFRVDGKFSSFKTLDVNIRHQLVTRIKILAGLKIDENRLPQDGKAVFVANNQKIDLRVSILPVIYGEKIVIRILKKTVVKLTLQDLGFVGTSLEKVQKALQETYGIILATGPTGSGKSTTLYALLSNFDPAEVNISTLEDPVEYNMKGINQSQINPAIGFDFADGLRSLLRQDPDIIMVGEVRDKKTAQLAIESALTGHLVFSTLHTNDSATTIQRLVDMGVERFLITSCLRLAVAQRLVRQVCPYCRVPFKLQGEVRINVMQHIGKLLDKDIDEIPFFKPHGCPRCNNMGYKGRIGIYEVLEMTPSIQNLVLQENIDSNAIREQSIREGLITLLQDGLIKAAAGVTTVEEVFRVVGV